MLTLESYAHLQAVNEGWYIDPNTGLVYGPKAVHALLPEAATQPLITPRSIIHHTNAGSTYAKWQQLVAFMRRLDITGEAHADIDLDGTFAQAMPLNRRADCNAKANRWAQSGQWYGALSWETADLGAASVERTPWTVDQLATIIAVDTAACATYAIACTDGAHWTASGLFTHNRFPEFSIFRGKTCPGAARSRQMDYVRSEVAKRLAEFHRLNGTSCPGGA